MPAPALTTRDPVNAFLDLPGVAVRNAQAGPLSGLTLGVKDIFDVAGYVTGCGNPEKAAHGPVAEKTAPAVQMLLDAGARFAGKTQTDELAFSLFGQNSHLPHPVNPKAPSRVTGGSSSGSAAAVAGRLADITTGSDTGGSIRAPASFCGLVGLRTTHGRISLEGAMPLAPSLDTFGWFATDLEIYTRVAGVLLGALPPSLREGKVRVLRLASLDDLVLGSDEAAEYRRMTRLVADAVGGAATVPPLAPSIDDLFWTFRRTQAREAWIAHGEWISAHPGSLGKGVDERFKVGATVTPVEAAADASLRQDFRLRLRDVLGDDGFLALPTVPGAAPKSDSTPEQFQAYRERALRLLCWAGLSGFPQITLPLGTADGAPFGISLLGPAGSDLDLIRLGRAIIEGAKVKPSTHRLHPH